MADNKELSAMIDQLVETKTFSLDALDAIKTLKDKASDLERMLTSRTESLRLAETNIRTHTAKETVEGWIKREGEIVAREKSIHTVDRDAAVSKAKADTYSDVFKTVFANRILRENVMESTSMPVNNGGYTTFQTTNNNKSAERTES